MIQFFSFSQAKTQNIVSAFDSSFYLYGQSKSSFPIAKVFNFFQSQKIIFIFLFFRILTSFCVFVQN